MIGAVRVEQQRRNVAFLLDITERKRAEAHATFLAQAGAVLASSLDYERTLQSLAIRRAVLADWCRVDVVMQDGHIRRLAVPHADPKRSPAQCERLLPPNSIRRAAWAR